jgi:hypothetical protein
VGYGRKGKGSQRHLIADGAGRPLAFMLSGVPGNGPSRWLPMWGMIHACCDVSCASAA